MEYKPDTGITQLIIINYLFIFTEYRCQMANT